MTILTPRPWFRRHAVLALMAVNVAVFLFLGTVAEIALRFTIPFNPGYYVSVGASSRELAYPYGTIYINSHGFADKEFDLSNPDRIGYFGDSVTYGTGAGYGYRISEFLEEVYPEYEHMNFGGIDLSASDSTIRRFAALAGKFDLKKAIYLLNLNDLLPDGAVEGTEKTTVTSVRVWVQHHLDWMRGRSYLYTYLRNVVKSYLATRGTGWLGYPAYEFFPSKNDEVIRDTAERINFFRRLLAEMNIELIVVLLPYEMQISAEAASTYADLGVRWEDGFLGGATQRIILKYLDEEIPCIDAYYSFVDSTAPEKSRNENGLGEYFVYNKGDKLDWNHLNREGHRAVANLLIREKILGEGRHVRASDLDGPQ